MNNPDDKIVDFNRKSEEADPIEVAAFIEFIDSVSDMPQASLQLENKRLNEVNKKLREDLERSNKCRLKDIEEIEKLKEEIERLKPHISMGIVIGPDPVNFDLKNWYGDDGPPEGHQDLLNKIK